MRRMVLRHSKAVLRLNTSRHQPVRERANSPSTVTPASHGGAYHGLPCSISNCAGAAGFLAGRALWSDALALWPDRSAMAAHLAGTGRERLRSLKQLMAREGRPWQPPPWSAEVQAEGEFARAR